jgi:transcriptional regulator NrdR family protein
MKCPSCHSDTRVYDSRHVNDEEIRRWRQCENCKLKFITIENISRMVKKWVRKQRVHNKQELRVV